MSSADTDTPTDEAGEETVETDEVREAVLARFADHLGDALVASHILPGKDLWLRITRDAWVDAHRFAKIQANFGFFEYLSAIDWQPSPYGRYEDSVIDGGDPSSDEEPKEFDPTPQPGYTGGDTRFQVISRVFDVEVQHLGVHFKVDIPDDDLWVPTLIPVYAGANWHERELHEMFGIHVEGHPYLANLYLPGEFEGYPLRKDFPLVARIVKPWPGIVDVEPMPDDGDDDASDAEGDS